MPGAPSRNPTYEQVGTDLTGHAESVQVYYDPAVISYAKLLDAFFAGHDPTTLNRQGPDTGRDYRSVAFYRTPAEKAEILAAIKRTNESKHYPNPVVTEVTPITVFYPPRITTRTILPCTPTSPTFSACRCPRSKNYGKQWPGT
jgi:peptide-methionine (S)-S-oxide reductase